MSDVVQSLRQALQDVVAPELREHRVLLTALDSKIDSRTAELRAEMSGMRTELTALGSKIDSRTAELRAEMGGMRTELTALDSKIDSRTAELRAEMGGMRTELRGEIHTVRTELDKVKLAVQSGFEKLQHGLETAVLRGEVSTVRELADLRSRVERIEDHLKLRQDEPGIQRQQ